MVIPLANLVRIALSGESDIWADLVAYVIPEALRVTVLLLAGVAALTALIGVGTAWLVTAYRFPGRDTLAWALALPLAFPTYIVAYVYVDIFDAFGPVQNAAARAHRLAARRARSWYPNIRSLPGAIFVFSLVLYPYVFLAARAMFQTQSACLFEVARTLGATRFMLARHVALPLARPALAVGLSLALMEALNDIGACEYLGVRTLTLSIFTTWLNRSSLPGAAQIACVMLVAIAALIALERYGQRDKRFHLSHAPRAAAGADRLGDWRNFGSVREPPRRLAASVYEAVATVGLEAFINRRVAELSVGQFQRALFARLLLQDADVILLDEPFAALDENTTDQLLSLLQRWRDKGQTIVAVLHDLDRVRLHFPSTLLLARSPIAWGDTSLSLSADNLVRAHLAPGLSGGGPFGRAA